MINYLFKSPRRLANNSQLTEGYLLVKLESIQKELRHQRCDLVDIKGMLNRLMIDKHLQMQVDTYFDGDETSPQTDSENKPDLD